MLGIMFPRLMNRGTVALRAFGSWGAGPGGMGPEENPKQQDL